MWWPENRFGGRRWMRPMWRRGWGGPWGRRYYYRRGGGCCCFLALPFLMLPFIGAALLVLHMI